MHFVKFVDVISKFQMEELMISQSIIHTKITYWNEAAEVKAKKHSQRGMNIQFFQEGGLLCD